MEITNATTDNEYDDDDDNGSDDGRNKYGDDNYLSGIYDKDNDDNNETK